MKFCKNLQRIVDISDPEWAPYWTNYKMLKKLIKELPSLVPNEDGGTERTMYENCDTGDISTTTNTIMSRNDVSKDSMKECEKEEKHTNAVVSTNMNTTSLGETVHNKAKAMGKSPGEIAFFKLLHAELKKASYFFDRAQVEFSIREERVREGMEIMKQPNSIMVNEKWSCLAKSIYRLYKDLLLLETFAIMTYCSFSKILKKHDKVTGYKTRNAFMANVVNKANFTSYPKVSEMIKRCEALYDEVSQHLIAEGNSGLCEDERLFINMIHRLNGQIIDKAEEEGAPGTDLKKEHHNRRQSLGVAAASSSLSPSGRSNKAREAASSLQSLVEENDAKPETNSACLSDDDDSAAANSKTDFKLDGNHPTVGTTLTLIGTKRNADIEMSQVVNQSNKIRKCS